MTHAMTHKQANGLVGVVTVAALLGAAAALLLAPRSGKETRDGIKRKLHEAQERSQQKATEMHEAATTKVDEMRGKAEDLATATKDAATEARSQVEDAAAETTPRPRSRRSTPL